MSMTIKLEGLEDTLRSLKQLDNKGRGRVLRKGLRRSSSVVRKAMIRATLHLPEAIAGVIVAKVRVRVSRDDNSASIGPSGKKSALIHLFELGTKDRHTKKGAARGAIKPGFFLLRAWNASKDKAADILRKTFLEGLEEEWRRR